MSVGVLGAFIVAIVMTPACLIALKPISPRACERISADWMVQALKRLQSLAFNRYRLCAILGLVFFVVMLAGLPFIGIDTDIMRLFVESSRPFSDLHFVESKLSSVHSVELIIDAGQSAFKRPDSWKKLSAVSDKLKSISDIERIDYPLPLFEYVHSIVSKSGTTRDELFDNPKLTSNIMMLIRSGSDGRKLLERYLDDQMGRVRLTLAIKNGNGTPIGTIIDRIRKVVSSMVAGWAKCSITGELAVYIAQASYVVHSMVISLLAALFSITVLLVLQFRSLVLGLLSLIPNLLPLATIFGLMGWAGVPLDNVTVFVVAVAIGLSVDDTIHYLTQLRRSVRSTNSSKIPFSRHLMKTHDMTSRALASTSILLSCGLLMLCFTPSLPAVYFGLLAVAAIIAALVGDLVILPAIILAFPTIQKLIYRHSTDTKWNPANS
jgi:predicted RND superfamily exporter protein